MEVYPSLSASVDGIALYGHNGTSSHLSRLFSAVGLPVFLLGSSETIDRSSLPSHVTFIEERNDLPYLSSVLINCQNDFLSIQSVLTALPEDYRQRMAYVECSPLMRDNQLALLHEQMKFNHYLCMNLIEMETSTMIQPHLHLLCSGDELVFGKLLVQSRLPAKLTFLQHTKTPFDSFYLALFHRYSQAMHLAIYTEFFALLRTANPIYPGHLQFLFDWSYLKRPLMRQMILQSSSSSFTLTSIDEFQGILECILEHFFARDECPLKALTHKLHQSIVHLDPQFKAKPLFELFSLSLFISLKV